MAYGGEGLYERYAKDVYRYLFSLCADPDTAEELTQETFYQALKGEKSFRGDCSPQTWLCAIAKKIWLKELSRRKRMAPAEEALFLNLPSPDDPALEVERQSNRLALYQAMQQLAADTREVMYLRLAGEFSFREIGEITGHSEVWARVRFYRGKEELTRIMGGERDERT